MSTCRIPSTSTYLEEEIKIDSASAFRSIWEALMGYRSVVECAAKTIGIRLDNRASSDHNEQTKALKAQITSIEDMDMMDMGTADLGRPAFISAISIVKSRFCMSDEAGTILYNFMADALSKEKRVIISFKDVTDLSSVFFESVFGKLYLSGFTDREIKRRITVCDLSEEDRFILSRVINRVKDYKMNCDYFEAIMTEVLNEDYD